MSRQGNSESTDEKGVAIHGTYLPLRAPWINTPYIEINSKRPETSGKRTP
jgi:hypothetical protein